MSGQKWPLGSEVRRKDLTGGAMLYDASRAGNATASWFDEAFWRERGEIDGEARGRGTTYLIRSGKQNLVLRHYRRGGLVARVLRDRYFWRNESATRAFAEWQLLYHLHRAGLPVPAPVAARFRRHGLIYTADIITERLMDSVSLAELLRIRGIPILGWITIGRCIRAFHDLGVCHPDLNAHNILLVGDDAVYLIDFDRGRLLKPGLWCDENLVRLRRSLEKITYQLPPEHFGEADWHGLLDGYRQSGGMPGAPRTAKASRDETSALNRALSVAADFEQAVATAPAGAAPPAVTTTNKVSGVAAESASAPGPALAGAAGSGVSATDVLPIGGARPAAGVSSTAGVQPASESTAAARLAAAGAKPADIKSPDGTSPETTPAVAAQPVPAA